MSHIAIDIGATNIRVAVGNKNGIKKRLIEPTDKLNGPQGVSAQIIRIIDKLSDKPKTIGIGSIGPINTKTGTITNTPNYPFNQIPITKPLDEKYGIKSIMVNDCSAAVMGERIFGAGKGLKNIFYVTLSTGLGGGAIVDGHLLSGKDGNAPEIGHVTVCYDSDLVCGCGAKGHWEAYSSGMNLPNFATAILKEMEWKNSLLYKRSSGKMINLDTKMIFNAAREGDKTSLKIVEEIGKINTVGFANIVNTFDPELITLGGSVALNNPSMILNPIRMNIDQHIINRKPEIMITPLRDDIVLFGALALALHDTYPKVSRMLFQQ